MLASVLRVCAKGVPWALESKRLPLSTNPSCGATLTSRWESRLLKNGKRRFNSRKAWVLFTVLSVKSNVPSVRAMLYTANLGGSPVGLGLSLGALSLAKMSSMS